MSAVFDLTPEMIADQRLGGVASPPTHTLMDAQYVSHDGDAGILTLSFAAKHEFTNPAGIIQGGILTAMLDDTMGPLIVLALRGEKFPSSTDLHTTFYKAAQPGQRLTVEARIDRLGGTICYSSAIIKDEVGDVIAKCVHTARLLSLK